jgi:hypothetical protein
MDVPREGEPDHRLRRGLLAVLSLVAVVQRWRDKIRLGFGLRGGVLRELFEIPAHASAQIPKPILVEWALGAIHVEQAQPEVGELAGPGLRAPRPSLLRPKFPRTRYKANFEHLVYTVG